MSDELYIKQTHNSPAWLDNRRLPRPRSGPHSLVGYGPLSWLAVGCVAAVYVIIMQLMEIRS